MTTAYLLRAISNARGPTPSPVSNFFSSVEGGFALGWRREALSRSAHILVAVTRRIQQAHGTTPSRVLPRPGVCPGHSACKADEV